MNFSDKIKNLILFSFVFVILILLGESILRAFNGPPPKRRLPEVKYNYHAIRRFTIRPNQNAYTYGQPSTIDFLGFRLNGRQQSEKNDYLIFSLGDSFTFGLGVMDSLTWPAILENSLNKKSNLKFRVINGGTISYGVFQEMDLFREKGLTMKPDIVIHALYWNDYMNAEPPSEDEPRRLTDEGYFVWDQLEESNQMLQKSIKLISENSAFAYSFKLLLKSIFNKKNEGTSSYSNSYYKFIQSNIDTLDWRPIKSFYHSMYQLSINYNFKFYVVILPVFDIVEDTTNIDHPFRTYVKNLLDKFDISYVDCFEIWKTTGSGKKLFLKNNYDAHLNSEGYRLVSSHLYKLLEQDLELQIDN